MRRKVVPELLDSDLGTPQEIADGLADLRMINRNFGGHATTISLLERVANARKLASVTVLDVAGASGDTMQEASAAFTARGVSFHTAILDMNPTHMTRSKGIAWVVGDATRLPFRDTSFDVVTCSLFMHHLEPEQIHVFLREALRVCRAAVLINDLRRSYLHLLVAYAGRITYRSRLTRHDAPVSVCRSYTAAEIEQMIRKVHPGKADISKHTLFRIGAILWK